MEAITAIISYINANILWGIPMIVAIMGTGILLTVRTRFLQVKRFGMSIRTTIVPVLTPGKKAGKRKAGEKTISQFEAFAAAVSGTVGTGNIVGVATAMLAGGPGAVFWMWVSAFFGLVTNYSENVLGLYFRKKDKNGNVSGGPMYYISEGLGLRWLALIFAFCCSLAAIGMGMVQANSISGTLQNVIAGENARVAQIVAIVTGIAVAALAALIIIGGIKRIGRVASMIVPFMTLLFILAAIVILCLNIRVLPAAVALIFTSAFNFSAVSGGFFGYMITKAMRYCFARGIFSNEAGLGSSVIAHSASATKEPVRQGLWGIFEVFLDTFIICTLTALSLLTVAMQTGKIDFTDITANASLSGNTLAPMAFTESFGSIGAILFAIILPLFAFTTIMAWSYYGEKAVGFLFGEKHQKLSTTIFKFLYVGLLVVGALVSSSLVWELDDMFNAAMALPNLIALIALSGLVARISKNYFDRQRGIALPPMLSAYPERNEELIKELETHPEDI